MKRKRQSTVAKTVRALLPVAKSVWDQVGRMERKYQSRSLKRRRYSMRRGGRQRLRRYKGRLTQKKIKKKLRAVCQFMQQQNATHIHRQRETGWQNVDARHCAYKEIHCGGNKNQIESAMTNLRYFDAGINGLVSADPATGTYHRDIRLSIYRSLLVRNNYLIPCDVKIYNCRPRVATQKTAHDLFLTGIADQGNPGVNSPLVHLTDSKDATDVWNCKLVCKKRLYPGGECKVTDFQKLFKYEISTNDEHSVAYDPKQGGHVWIIRVCGVIAHDTLVPGEVKSGQAAVDYICDTTYKFEYDAGKDLHDVSVNDPSGATIFTNTGVASQFAPYNTAFKSAAGQ